MSKKALLCCAALLCGVSLPVMAKYCVKLPSCEELGYIFPAKEGRRFIRCPFDTSKVLYLDYCQAYGLTSKPDEAAGSIQECVEEKADGTKINTGYYRYIRCNTGYMYKSGTCVQLCNLTSTYQIPNCKTQESCKTEAGETRYGSCSECLGGYDLQPDGSCARTCYGKTSRISDCSSHSTCELETSSGTFTTYYSCNYCDTDYELTDDGTCSNTCEYTNSSVPIGCNSTSSCYDDYGYKRYSSKCTGSCWTGYTKDSSGECVQSCHYSERWSMDGCINEDSCTIQTNSSGSTTTYYAGTCSSCYVGYSNSGGGCSQTCYSNSNTSHCVSSEQCQLGSASGTSTNTLCLTCEDGYYSSQGYCHDCSGMVPGRTGLTTEPSCSSSEEKKSYPCGNKTYYYCTSK